MITVEIQYRGRTKIISAAHIEIEKGNGAFEIYVLDVAGVEHRENSANEELEFIHVDKETRYGWLER